MLLEFTELFLCAVFTRQVSKFEKYYQIIVKLSVFENILHKLGYKHTVVCSTLTKQNKISLFIGLLAIPKHLLNLAQKLEVITIVISSAASLVEKTLNSKQLRHSTLPAYCFLLLGFDNP
jgi:hypothetical protein